MRWNYVFFLGLVSGISLNAEALVSCAPATCTPACGDTCTYQVCGQVTSMAFGISKLPHAYVTPVDACEDNLNGVVFNQIPLTVDGQVYSKIQTSIQHQYKICVNQVATGPACP